MDIASQIADGFDLSEGTIISDKFIIENDDLMWLQIEIDHMVYVPSYMLWCIRNKDKDGNLVCDYTISALAEYGRVKNTNNNAHFKFRCSTEQRELVCLFLSWCEDNLDFCNVEQIQRSIKQWRKSS